MGKHRMVFRAAGAVWFVGVSIRVCVLLTHAVIVWFGLVGWGVAGDT